MKYSIWVIPPEPVFTRLSEIITDLSLRYKSPLFKPHMTVLGSIDQELNKIKEAVEKVAANNGDLKLSLGPISFSTTYFQSVFVRINSTAKLIQLNLDIKKLLHIENNVYMPHISLIYGNHDMKIRDEIATKIQLQNFVFTANEIVVIPDDAEPSKWKPIVTVPL